MPCIEVKENSRIPKYKQIIDEVLRKIELGQLEKGERLPSINQVSEECFLSRDTVEKAYNHLKSKNIIESVRGKGYYVLENGRFKQESVLFFTNSSSHFCKEVFHNYHKYSGDKVDICLVKWENCPMKIEQFIDQQADQNDQFVFYLDGSERKDPRTETRLSEILKMLDPDKTTVIGSKPRDFSIKSKGLYFDEIFNLKAMSKELIPSMSKYDQIICVDLMDEYSEIQRFIKAGFEKFALDHRIAFSSQKSPLKSKAMVKRTLYLILQDTDLHNVKSLAQNKDLEIGQDCGVITIEDHPLKSSSGISAIDIDYQIIGKYLSEITKRHDKMPSRERFIKLVNRKSL